MHKKQIYPIPVQGSKFEFRVWAANANSVNLVIKDGSQIHKMNREAYGYWSLQVDDIIPGTRYKYQIDEKETYPDPASLSQPDGGSGIGNFGGVEANPVSYHGEDQSINITIPPLGIVMFANIE